MPSTFKHPAHVPMWRGAKVAYFFIALCIFPISIGGFWAYGNLVSSICYIFLVYYVFLSINCAEKWIWLFCKIYQKLWCTTFLGLIDAFRRYARCSVCIPHSRHSERLISDGVSFGSLQLLEQLSDILHARLWQLWGWLHKQDQQAVFDMGEIRFPSLFRVCLVFHRCCTPFPV